MAKDSLIGRQNGIEGGLHYWEIPVLETALIHQLIMMYQTDKQIKKDSIQNLE